MLLCAVLLHGGCGSRTTEETEKVDTTENFDLIGTEGWETVYLWRMDSHRCQKGGYMG